MLSGSRAQSPPLMTAATSPERPGALTPDTRDTADLAAGSRPPASVRRRANAPEQPHDRLGRVLGNYRLIELIGRGGMGWVYRAEHVRLGRQVALKLLKPEYALRHDSVARFFQEARAVNKIRHRNIVDITDFVELDDHTTFIIMELLRGQPLSSLARTQGPLPQGRLLAILAQIADSLGATHEEGIVHRDMKPDNIFIVDPGDGSDLVKLLDFGVAKLIAQDEDAGWETKAGSVIGTPAYMSPEQAGGLQVDGRSDIYSVGAIMYELFCGQPMFRARSFGEYVRLHLNEAPPHPRRTELGSSLDPRVEQMILRCIAKSPDARYQSMRALRNDLLEALGAIETGMLTPSLAAPSGLRAPHPTPHHVSSTAPVPRHSPASRMPWLFAAGAVFLGVAAGLAFFLAARGDGPDSTEAQRAANPPPVTAPQQPVVSSIDPPSDPVVRPPAQITIRFTSEPSGATVTPTRGGSSGCRTPCDFTIDPGDGGSLVRRQFAVRRRGYQGTTVDIDLSAPPERRHISMRRASSRAEEEPDPVEDPANVPEDVVGDPPRDPPRDRTPRPPPDKIDPEDTLDPFDR